MRFDQNQGIEITDEIRAIFKAGIAKEGSQGKLALAMGVPPQNIQNWRGEGKHKGEFILWNQWEKIRPYFVSRGLIDGNDPRWLTPSEMRERLAGAPGAQLPPDELKILSLYRLLTDEGKGAAVATLQALANTLNKDGQPSARSAG